MGEGGGAFSDPAVNSEIVTKTCMKVEVNVLYEIVWIDFEFYIYIFYMNWFMLIYAKISIFPISHKIKLQDF